MKQFYLPDHYEDLGEDETIAALREDFKHLTGVGYSVEIQIGPNDA